MDEAGEALLLRPEHLVRRVVAMEIGDVPCGNLTMGLGANWHPPTQGREGYPEPDNEEGWKEVFDAMTWCGIRWMRFWVDGEVSPEPGCVVTDHPCFRMLKRVDEWAAETRSSIVLDLSYPPLHDYRFSKRFSAVRDPDFYVANFAMPIIRHVLCDMQIRNIGHVNFFNEPFNADGGTEILFGAPEGEDPYDLYFRVLEGLRKGMDDLGEAGKRVALLSPDSSAVFQRLPEAMARAGFGGQLNRLTGRYYDVHMWRSRLSYYPQTHCWPTFTVDEGIERFLKPTIEHARKNGKELVVTETNSMYYNNGTHSLDVTRHDCFLTAAEVMIRMVNEGVAGCLNWTFLSAGRSDGQWQWIDVPGGTYEIRPHLYYGYGTIMRYHEPGADSLPVAIPEQSGSEFIHGACIVWDERKEGTVWLVNDHPVEFIDVELELPALSREEARWQWWTKDNFLQHELVDAFAGGRIKLTLGPMSMNALSTREGPGGPGDPNRSTKERQARPVARGGGCFRLAGTCSLPTAGFKLGPRPR